MHYSKLATVLSRQQKNRQFKAFHTCEIITIDRSLERGLFSSFLLEIAKYRFNFDSGALATFSILKLNNR